MVIMALGSNLSLASSHLSPMPEVKKVVMVAALIVLRTETLTLNQKSDIGDDEPSMDVWPPLLGSLPRTWQTLHLLYLYVVTLRCVEGILDILLELRFLHCIIPRTR